MGENPKEKHEVLEDIVSDSPGSFEFTEWLIEHSSIPRRVIMQAYMVWKFKYNWKEPDSDKAWQRWVSEGYSKSFSDYYTDKISVKKLYERLNK